MTLPHTAYILLWFPKASETFIFREVVNLNRLGLPVKVFTLYGELHRSLSPEMAGVSVAVERLGLSRRREILSALSYWRRRRPDVTRKLWRTVPFRRWRSPEAAGENLWAFLCGFHLARCFEEQGIEHIHAPWGNGPATAAWVASRLSGIPFSFTGRAGDIFPPDGALLEKIQAATFIRTNMAHGRDHLQNLAPEAAGKMHVVYNGYPLRIFREAPVRMQPPYQLLGVGRFVVIKGFDYLLHAARILLDQGWDFHLTLAGSGPRGWWLKALTRKLGLGRRVSFPGFVTYDQVSRLFAGTDIFLMPCVVHRTGDRDGIPNVIMEALLHQLPVVATAVSGVGEVVVNEETGILAPSRDPEALAQAVVRLVHDRCSALAMAEKGRRRVLEQFDPETNHQMLVELFGHYGRG